MLDVVRTLMAFNAKESCGKCTPCREGTARLLVALTGRTDGGTRTTTASSASWARWSSSPRCAASARRPRSRSAPGWSTFRPRSGSMEAMALRLTIDGRADRGRAAGATVLDAVNRLGVPLPQLCKDPDRPPLGACRTCLVEVEGQRGFPASCHLPARDGMVVRTASPGAVRVRAGGPRPHAVDADPAAARGTASASSARPARAHGLAAPSFEPLHRFPADETKSFFVLDREACILCGRCTTACDDVQRIGAISLIGKGHAEKVGVFGDGPMASSICTSCGQCVATCPTGALRPKEAAPRRRGAWRRPARTAASAAASSPRCARTAGWP